MASWPRGGARPEMAAALKKAGDKLAVPAIDAQWAAGPVLNGGEAPTLSAQRRQAMEGFRLKGLPTPRVEPWKYTNLNRLAEIAFAAPANDPTPPSTLPAGLLPDGSEAIDVVLVNGRLRPDAAALAALPPGVAVQGLSDALRLDPSLAAALGAAGDEADAMLALNTALMTDGVVIRVAPGVTVDRPIHLLSVGRAGPDAPIAFHPRHLIQLGAGARLTLIESHVGDGRYWSHPAMRLLLGTDARLDHCKLQAEGAEAFHIAHAEVRLEAGALYESVVLQTGALIGRNEIHVRLAGERAACNLFGFYLGRGQQHHDCTTEIVHAEPRTSSREIYKGVLDDRARGVFQGKIAVARNAQKADGHQLSKTLLLSDRAEIDTKPELEIFADDVKCSHGAAAGELDDDALFYLRARGIGLAAARRMLIEAFLDDLLQQVDNTAARLALGLRIAAWLAALPATEGA